LRQIVSGEMKKQGLKCRCIRCREVKENYNPREKLYFFRQDYNASGGREIFLSYENKDRTRLYSLLRLRIPSFYRSRTPVSSSLFKVLKNSAIIRELHTYGQLHPLGNNGQEQFLTRSPQHRGIGKKLIKEAERIAEKEFGLKKIAVISGVGVRRYYQKLGYKLKDTYMTKKLPPH